MKKFQAVVLLLLFSAMLNAHASASSFDLIHWGFNLNGNIYMGGPEWGYDPLSDSFDDSGFDWDSGVGSISVTFDPGSPGDYYVLSWFNHEIDMTDNTYFNEYGAAVGTPGAGQSWEIDEPGYFFGDITDNLAAGSFDNTNNNMLFPDDPSMGMGWNFTLEAGEKAVITFLLSEEVPEEFYLVHTDPDSQKTLYFSTHVPDGDSPAVPEPGTALLLGAGLLGVACFRKKYIWKFL